MIYLRYEATEGVRGEGSCSRQCVDDVGGKSKDNIIESLWLYIKPFGTRPMSGPMSSVLFVFLFTVFVLCIPCSVFTPSVLSAPALGF